MAVICLPCHGLSLLAFSTPKVGDLALQLFSLMHTDLLDTGANGPFFSSGQRVTSQRQESSIKNI